MSDSNKSTDIIKNIEQTFNINYLLFIVPILIIYLIIKKTPPLISLIIGSILGGIFALIFQPSIILEITNSNELNFKSAYMGIINSMTIFTEIKTENEILNNLFQSGGMKGMLGTIWLIVCAMTFGGVMEAIGALKSITDNLLKIVKSNFGLVFNTGLSCITINLTASDQYLSIIIPGKMFAKTYKKKNLAPVNLSRTLEDTGTVTSALIPWNTCGAYHSGVLGVSVTDYLFFSVFNLISPIMTLIYSYFNLKIKKS
jgi:NhaC family Na+:H+ antiporter